jgi:hypothetical protein
MASVLELQKGLQDELAVKMLLHRQSDVFTSSQMRTITCCPKTVTPLSICVSTLRQFAKI